MPYLGKTQRHAWDTLRQAVNKRQLSRPHTCSSCGKLCKAEGHHEDYSRPLEVIWLCRKCHSSFMESQGPNLRLRALKLSKLAKCEARRRQKWETASNG